MTGKPSEPRHFSEQQLDRCPNYSGPLERLSEEQVRFMLTEMLRYFNFRPTDMPLPPVGLPGFHEAKEDDPQRALIELGYRYFQSVALNQGRGMNLVWRQAAELLAKEAGELRERRDADLEEARRAWTPPPEPPRPDKLVYFIGAETGPIKIGIATNPIARLSTLQTGHHEKLELLAVTDGGEELEKAYHKLFGSQRRVGEWFDRCPELLAEIDRLNQAASLQGR